MCVAVLEGFWADQLAVWAAVLRRWSDTAGTGQASDAAGRHLFEKDGPGWPRVLVVARCGLTGDRWTGDQPRSIHAPRRGERPCLGTIRRGLAALGPVCRFMQREATGGWRSVQAFV